MNSRDRLLHVLTGRATDRVPISTYELVGWNPDAWENREPSYRRLMDLIRAKTDCLYMWDSGSWGIAPELLEVETWEDDGKTYTRRTCRAPRRSLTSLEVVEPRIKTVWVVERFLKDEADVHAFLELPFAHTPPDVRQFDERTEALGERGIIMHSVSDALCVTAELFSFSTFLLLCATERPLIRRVMDTVQAEVLAATEARLEAGFGPLFRVCGPEYATPPYLRPEDFREFVVAYDRPLFDLIHRHGKYVRLHSHGKIGRVLDAIEELGPDALDPVEPPPDGDMTLSEVKERTRGRITLFGNLELKHLEHARPAEVEALTRRAIEEGTPGGRYVIMPSAAPINIPLSPATEENYRVFIETALECGAHA